MDTTDSEQDSCIAGPRTPTTDACYHDGLLNVRPPDTIEVFHEIEQFVRRKPWFFLALGFFAGYLLARGKVR